jgi:hypothetical protein
MTGTPLAYGTFNSTGAKQFGSSNISCSWIPADTWYACSITGQNYFYTQFVTNITPFAFAIPVAASVGGNLLVIFYNPSGNQIQAASGFGVTVYKP